MVKTSITDIFLGKISRGAQPNEEETAAAMEEFKRQGVSPSQIKQNISSARGAFALTQRTQRIKKFEATEAQQRKELATQGLTREQIADLIEKRRFDVQAGATGAAEAVIERKERGANFRFNPKAIVGSRKGFEKQIELEKKRALAQGRLVSEIPPDAFTRKTLIKTGRKGAEQPGFRPKSKGEPLNLTKIRAQQRLADQQTIAKQTGLPLKTIQNNWKTGQNFSKNAPGYEKSLDEGLAKLKAGENKVFVAGVGDITTGEREKVLKVNGKDIQLRPKPIKQFGVVELPKGAKVISEEIVDGGFQVTFIPPQKKEFRLTEPFEKTETKTLGQITEAQTRKQFRKIPLIGDFFSGAEKVASERFESGIFRQKSGIVEERALGAAEIFTAGAIGTIPFTEDVIFGAVGVGIDLVPLSTRILTGGALGPSQMKVREANKRLAVMVKQGKETIKTFQEKPLAAVIALGGGIIVPEAAIKVIPRFKLLITGEKISKTRGVTFITERELVPSKIITVKTPVKASIVNAGIDLSQTFTKGKGLGLTQELKLFKQQPKINLLESQIAPSEIAGLKFKAPKQLSMSEVFTRLTREQQIPKDALVVKTSVQFPKGAGKQIPPSAFEGILPTEEIFKGRTVGEIVKITKQSPLGKLFEPVTQRLRAIQFKGIKEVPTTIRPKLPSQKLGTFNVDVQIRKLSQNIPIQTKTGKLLQDIGFITEIKGEAKIFSKKGIQRLTIDQIQFARTEKLTRPDIFEILGKEGKLNTKLTQLEEDLGIFKLEDLTTKKRARALEKVVKPKAKKTRILPEQPKSIEIMKTFTEGLVGKEKVAGFEVSTEVLTIPTREFGDVVFSLGEARAVKAGKITGPRTLTESALVNIIGKERILKSAEARTLELKQLTSGKRVSETRLQTLKQIKAPPIRFELPSVLETRITPPSIIKDFPRGTFVVFAKPKITPTNQFQTSQRQIQIQKQKAQQQQKEVFKEIQTTRQKQIQRVKKVEKKAKVKEKSVEEVFTKQPSTSITNILTKGRQRVSTVLQFKKQKVFKRKQLKQKEIQQEKIREKQIEKAKERIQKQLQRQPTLTIPKQLTKLTQLERNLQRRSTIRPPPQQPPIIRLKRPPLPPVQFRFGELQKRKGKVIKKKKERKFSLTSDIVSQSFGITAKKINIFAAITGQGLRPRIVKGGNKRGSA